MTSRGRELISREGKATTTGEDLLLPEGTVVLHIGPPKTGTSTVQGAFHAARGAVRAQGVRYVGRSRHSGTGVLAVTGRPSFRRDSGPPPKRAWNELVGEIRSAREPRLLLSSEFFADAEPDAIARIVGDLASSRLHVLVTLRPLTAILPSQWQQYVQSFMPLAYDEWLDGVLSQPRGAVTPTFWRRHRHDELIDRWAQAVGVENMTAVVIDENDHDQILRTFEGLLGLDVGTLVADADLANRSMTWPEIEAVRAFSVAFREAGLGNALYHRVMHFGAAAFMKARPLPPDEPRIETPPWALARSAEVQREMVGRIAALGVRVVGDLASTLDAPDGRPGGDGRQPACVPLEVAARMSMGIIVVAGLARGMTVDRGDLRRFATYQLGGVLLARAVRAARRRLARLAGRRSPGSGAAGENRRRLDDPEALALAALEQAIRIAGAIDGVDGLVRSVEHEMAAQPVPDRPEHAGSECVPPHIAGSMAMAVLVSTGLVMPLAPPRLRAVWWPWVEPPEVAVVRNTRLARVVAGRLVGAVGMRLAAIKGRGRSRSAT